MDFLRRLNIFALLLPFVILAIEYLYHGSYFALALTMITGFLQVFIAVMLIADKRISGHLVVYLALVILFFLLLWLTNWHGIWFLPPFLAVYLTCILYLDHNKPFLKAEWKKLLLINYEISPDKLKPFLPTGTEIELFNGKCYVSLVGFLFQNTRVCGVKIANHINFEEVNIRFYVTRDNGTTVKRGVVFIKEIVPRRAIAAIANLFYKEHYVTLPMRHSIATLNEPQRIEYGWKKNNRWNVISATYEPTLIEIAENSEAEFITEHYFGYTKTDDLKTAEYEVTHPRWKQYEIGGYQIDVDFKSTYGSEFAFLDKLQPSSLILAEGSEIAVRNKIMIT